MTTVLLLRHGETDWNRNRRVQGWAATGLNARGREQARAAGRWLAGTYELDRIVASDLRRTRETAATLRDAAADPLPEPEFVTDWRERSFGVFQGLTYEEVFAEFPEHNASEGLVGVEATPDGGESLLDLRERVLDGWETLLADHDDGDTVLVVTHGGPIYVLLAHLRNVDLPTALGELSQDNCAVNELRHDRATGDTTVHTENDTSYRDDESVVD